METEEGWKDVKKKTSKKSDSKVVPNNANGCSINNFSDYHNPSTPIIPSKKIITKNDRYAPLNIIETPVNKPSLEKYQIPHTKPKVTTSTAPYTHSNFKNNQNNGNSTTGATKGRGGKWGKRIDVSTIPDFENEDERIKFTELRKKYPHISIPGTIRREAILARIDNYAEKLLSQEWIDFQCNGWEFVRIIKPDDVDVDIPDDDKHELLNLENKYNDFALFKKIDK